RMLYLTGWRTGEVLGMTWSRVDFDAGTMCLDATDTKSGRPRQFPFRQLPALEQLLNEQRRCTKALARKRGQVIPWVFHLDGARGGQRSRMRGCPGCGPTISGVPPLETSSAQESPRPS